MATTPPTSPISTGSSSSTDVITPHRTHSRHPYTWSLTTSKEDTVQKDVCIKRWSISPPWMWTSIPAAFMTTGAREKGPTTRSTGRKRAMVLTAKTCAMNTTRKLSTPIPKVHSRDFSSLEFLTRCLHLGSIHPLMPFTRLQDWCPPGFNDREPNHAVAEQPRTQHEIMPKAPDETGMDDDTTPMWGDHHVAFTRKMINLEPVGDQGLMKQSIFKTNPALGAGMFRIPVGGSKPRIISQRASVRLALQIPCPLLILSCSAPHDHRRSGRSGSMLHRRPGIR